MKLAKILMMSNLIKIMLCFKYFRYIFLDMGSLMVLTRA